MHEPTTKQGRVCYLVSVTCVFTLTTLKISGVLMHNKAQGMCSKSTTISPMKSGAYNAQGEQCTPCRGAEGGTGYALTVEMPRVINAVTHPGV